MKNIDDEYHKFTRGFYNTFSTEVLKYHVSIMNNILGERADDRKLSEFDLSVRCIRACERLGITMIGELSTRTPEELLGFPFVGQKTIKELTDLLKENNLSWRE